MLLKVQVFCEVKLLRSDSNYRRFEELLCHHFQSPVIQKESDTRINHTRITHDIFPARLDCWNLKKKAL
jgi:hypothetical protein